MDVVDLDKVLDDFEEKEDCKGSQIEIERADSQITSLTSEGIVENVKALAKVQDCLNQNEPSGSFNMPSFNALLTERPASLVLTSDRVDVTLAENPINNVEYEAKLTDTYKLTSDASKDDTVAENPINNVEHEAKLTDTYKLTSDASKDDTVAENPINNVEHEAKLTDTYKLTSDASKDDTVAESPVNNADHEAKLTDTYKLTSDASKDDTVAESPVNNAEHEAKLTDTYKLTSDASKDDTVAESPVNNAEHEAKLTDTYKLTSNASMNERIETTEHGKVQHVCQNMCIGKHNLDKTDFTSFDSTIHNVKPQGEITEISGMKLPLYDKVGDQITSNYCDEKSTLFQNEYFLNINTCESRFQENLENDEEISKNPPLIFEHEPLQIENKPLPNTDGAITVKSASINTNDQLMHHKNTSEMAPSLSDNATKDDSTIQICAESIDFHNIEVEAQLELQNIASEMTNFTAMNFDAERKLPISEPCSQVPNSLAAMPVKYLDSHNEQNHAPDNLRTTDEFEIQAGNEFPKEQKFGKKSEEDIVFEGKKSGISECDSISEKGGNSFSNRISFDVTERTKSSEINSHYLASLQRPGIFLAKENKIDEDSSSSLERDIIPENLTGTDVSPPVSSEQSRCLTNDEQLPVDSPIPHRPSEAPTAGFDDAGQSVSSEGEINNTVSVKHWKLRLGSSAFSLLVVNQSQKDTDMLEAPPGLAFPKEGFMQPPPSTSYPSLSITDLGTVSPSWMPDANAASCLQCDARFTFTRRRHHCRACGKVFCNTCCNLKSKLTYMGEKEVRVCSVCYQDLIRAQVFKHMDTTSSASVRRTDIVEKFNKASHSDDSVEDQTASNSQSDKTAGASSQVGVLRKQGNDKKSSSTDGRESKQVMFCDGTRPGFSKVSSVVKKNKISATEIYHFIPKHGFPPLIKDTGEAVEFGGDTSGEKELVIQYLIQGKPILFQINRNLQVAVKTVNLDCCVKRSCLVFTSLGLCNVGQLEVIIVLEKQPTDPTLPIDIFKQFHYFYEQGVKGKVFQDMDYTPCFNQLKQSTDDAQPNQFLGSSENGGFLFLCPTWQCLKKLTDKQQYLFAVLLQKWEVPWAKSFPLRLVLRLGAESRYYPCSLVSEQNRNPVFAEIGHTIMNLLIDFQNYSYILPVVNGFTIEMKDQQIYLNLPKHKYEDFLRVLQSGSEHVFAIGAVFDSKADSYLVCMQNEDGEYHTEAINIQNKTRLVTGASFVVFSGALKPANHESKCKSSIVEDGLMIQLIPSLMEDIKSAIRQMTDITIQCSKSTNGEVKEDIVLQWVECGQDRGIQLLSPIDGRHLAQMDRIHINSFTDYQSDTTKAMRLTELFMEKKNWDSLEPVDITSLAERLAKAACEALVPVLHDLRSRSFTKIGVRAIIDCENVSYECGADGQSLPSICTELLDDKLIPVIHAAISTQRTAVILELIFCIVNV